MARRIVKEQKERRKGRQESTINRAEAFQPTLYNFHPPRVLFYAQLAQETLRFIVVPTGLDIHILTTTE